MKRPDELYPEWAVWMARRGYAPVTLTTYQRIVRRWRRSHLDARTWLLQAEEASRKGTGLPTDRARVYRRALVAWFEHVGGEAPDLSLPRVIRRSHPRPAAVVPTTSANALCAAFDQLPEPAATALHLLAATGLRISEGRTARLEQLDFGGAGLVALTVDAKRTSANDGVRTVPIPSDVLPRLIAYLRGWRATRKGPWLFPSPRGLRGATPVSEKALRGSCARVGHALGIRVHPHALRHLFATVLTEAGTPQALVSAALGHHLPGVTSRYQHPGVEAVAAAVERARR